MKLGTLRFASSCSVFGLLGLLTTACGSPGAAESPPASPPPPSPSASAAPAPAASAARPAPAQVDATRLLAAASNGNDWLTHGRTYDEQRFSPLKSVDASNVCKLGLAWSLDLDTHRGQEATPLVVDGVMYSTSAWSKVQAIDARTGQLLWQHDPKVPGETGAKACCDVVNRGVAVWKGKVYVGTLDGRLVALDAATGKEVWSVVTVDQTKKYTITGAPRIVKGKVLIGNGGAEFGVRGYISAYDAETGKMAWRFYTVPGDPSQPAEAPILKDAAKTWTGEWWKLGGGGTVWDSMAYDPELDLLYIGVGNGSPWNQRIRSPKGGDNLFLSSIVALKPDTGEYVWHFQETPGESWDYTATQHIVLADLTIEGQKRKVLMQAPKSGFFYVLDRQTGKLISAKPYATINWATGVDPATGRPKVNPAAYYGKTKKPWNAMPGPFGAHNWQPMSFNPVTGLVYIPVHDIPFGYNDQKDFAPNPIAYNVGVIPSETPKDPKAQAAMLAMVRGTLKAWDPVAQKEVFRVDQPGVWNGGTLSTAGGLVFQGNAAGFVKAYAADTGKELWSFQSQTGVIASPITYSVDGEQYVAIVVGWGGAFPLAAGGLSHLGSLTVNRSRVLAFKLGGTAKLPDAPPPALPTAKPPAPFGDAKLLPTGKAMFNGLCAVCHGFDAVAGGVLPDLRFSGLLGSAEPWAKTVIEGTRAGSGMPGFGAVIKPEHAELIRAWVVAQANETAQPAQPPPVTGVGAPATRDKKPTK